MSNNNIIQRDGGYWRDSCPANAALLCDDMAVSAGVTALMLMGGIIRQALLRGGYLGSYDVNRIQLLSLLQALHHVYQAQWSLIMMMEGVSCAKNPAWRFLFLAPRMSMLACYLFESSYQAYQTLSLDERSVLPLFSFWLEFASFSHLIANIFRNIMTIGVSKSQENASGCSALGGSVVSLLISALFLCGPLYLVCRRYRDPDSNLDADFDQESDSDLEMDLDLGEERRAGDVSRPAPAPRVTMFPE